MIITLEQKKEIKKAWDKKIEGLKNLFYAKNGKFPDNLFTNIEFLREFGDFRFRATGGSIYFQNDYPFQTIKKHYVIMQHPQSRNKFNFFHAVNIILNAEKISGWCLVQLPNIDSLIGTIPHVHLLLF